jgi:RimJ/RimL family protein N-acetyltransferase
MEKLPIEPRRARLEDHQTIVNLIKDAASWLHSKGTDQWARPWPSEPERDERIARGLESGATWMMWDGSTAVATITAYTQGFDRLWTPEELAQPSVYVHRLVVAREYSGRGIGAALIGWAAGQHDAGRVRVDVWSTNQALHRYYEGIGFRFLRVADYPGYPSGALFERSLTRA